MTTTLQMIETSPKELGDLDPTLLARCIDAALRCSQTCTACADACLGEDTVADLRRCIRTDLDCADVCDTTVRLLTRYDGGDPRLLVAVVAACVGACRRCGEECSQHAEHHDHCRVCADTCFECVHACEQLLSTLPR